MLWSPIKPSTGSDACIKFSDRLELPVYRRYFIGRQGGCYVFYHTNHLELSGKAAFKKLIGVPDHCFETFIAYWHGAVSLVCGLLPTCNAAGLVGVIGSNDTGGRLSALSRISTRVSTSAGVKFSKGPSPFTRCVMKILPIVSISSRVNLAKNALSLSLLGPCEPNDKFSSRCSKPFMLFIFGPLPGP